jgi:hypothetical protein
MNVGNKAMQWAALRGARRMSRSLPLAGALIALFTLRNVVRRKGLVRGGLDTGLNAMPFVGALKLGVESVLGRDLIRDRRPWR